MARSIRIAGVEIPTEKKINIALTYIYGIGAATAEKILELARVDKEKRANALSDDEVSRVRSVIEGGKVKIEGELRQEIYQNIKRLKDIRSYRGIRHKLGLPVRGQRTRTNAHTRKGKHIAVGGLKHKLEKT